MAPEANAKPISKKEIKKINKALEASTAASVNATTAAFIGGKRGKNYSWMLSGGGSAVGSPRPAGASTPGTPGGGVGAGAGKADLALTQSGRSRFGFWREDRDKGKGIQLRDWIGVLEADGRDPLALQKAYTQLEASNPK